MTDSPLLEYEGRVLIADPEFRVVVLGDDLKQLDKCITLYWGLQAMPEAHSWVTASIDPCSIGKLRDVLAWHETIEPSIPCAGYVASAKQNKRHPQGVSLLPRAGAEVSELEAAPAAENETQAPIVTFREWLAVTVKLLNCVLPRQR